MMIACRLHADCVPHCSQVGLHHAAARLLFQDLGVYFTNMQLQCVFLEIDIARCGRLDEGVWLSAY
jgi:hypothetical protein